MPGGGAAGDDAPGGSKKRDRRSDRGGWDPAAVVQILAASNVPALLTGETGTGKTYLARRIHEASARSRGPFVKVDCAAIPETLFESDLFGHKRGAFTGALADKAGKFRVADGGTIFLDEVGEMPPALQAKLLHVLDDGEFYPVGATTPARTDVRVIAATNKSIEEVVGTGAFRRDLYYRLAVETIHVPPLRERRAEILSLAARFLRKGKSRTADPLVREAIADLRTGDRGAVIRDAPAAPGLAPAALLALAWHTWPGNVRELENAIERGLGRLAARAETGAEPTIGLDDLPPEVVAKCDGLPTDLGDVLKALRASGLRVGTRILAPLFGVSHMTVARAIRSAA